MGKKSQVLRSLRQFIGIVSILQLLLACGAPVAGPARRPPTTTPALSPARPTTMVPTAERAAEGLSDEELATLSSLEMVDGYPLYTMRYFGSYSRLATSENPGRLVSDSRSRSIQTYSPPAWGCSLFAALGNPDQMLFGRNFDWEHSPAVLLFTDPSEGYASVSLVDIAYLGFTGAKAAALAELPLLERRALLDAPFLPFDGMNERGLAIGMAAVPPGQMRPDPARGTVGSLMVIRMILDQASTTDEAVAILQSHNIDMRGGPPIHYLIADPTGDSVLVEFYQGETVVIPNENAWQAATNFLLAATGDTAAGKCWRYDKMDASLAGTQGQIRTQDAMHLLADLSQANTQWSVVYGMSTGDVSVVMGQQYQSEHAFHLSLMGEE